MLKSLAVVIGVLALAGNASADSKSWAALKGKLPADPMLVAGADIGAIRATPSFGKLIDWLKTEDKDVGTMLGVVKDTCGMELPAMFADLSLVMGKDEKGVIVIGLNGTDQTKITDCFNKVFAKVDPKTKLGVKVTGKLTEYSIPGESDKLFATWLSPDVVAISLEKDGHVALDAMAQGKAAAGDLATYLGKANTAAPVWAAFAPNDDGLKGGFGAVTLGKTVALSLKMTGITPKDAAKARKEATDTMKNGAERSKKQPDLAKIFKAAKVGGKGADVTLDVSMPEAAIAQLLPALDKIF